MEMSKDRFIGVQALVTQCAFSQKYREYLKKTGILDDRYCPQKLEDGTVALPVLQGKFSLSLLQELTECVAPGSLCKETMIWNPVLSKRIRAQSPVQKLLLVLHELLESYGITWKKDLEHDLPHSWQRHNDLVVISEDCFRDPLWKQVGNELWTRVAQCLGVRRVAKQGRIQDDGMRSPKVTLVLGDCGWVEHVDNGIKYSFDVTKCMFAAGNIVEKQRLSKLCCSNETVVDLYAGIGYFTLPFLIHATAAFVHACEWNPYAVEALRRNLELNEVSYKCQIHEGDNRQVALRDVADRVNLGLIPTSEAGYPIACKVLKKNSGGVLHIHHNVSCYPSKQELNIKNAEKDSKSWKKFKWRKCAEFTEMKIQNMLEQVHGTQWKTNILNIHKVKSYAPHVDHIVVDLECRPLLNL
ncbi:tRNA wybutosine-synthesizing protein 2 homolog [Hyperolius riggenbachi]|uniref:tRNA wybutosine-synthesizing protein 2 homolog n=1 Tax=Hyperolius riggenbachi TaxID=752182 RepID=UPI0035A39927